MKKYLSILFLEKGRDILYQEIKYNDDIYIRVLDIKDENYKVEITKIKNGIKTRCIKWY